MLIARTTKDLTSTLTAWRQAGHEWAFVPTMGALHEGHLSLVRQAQQHTGRVVVSVFVNPTQFDRDDDLARYPRQPERDAEMLRSRGVDLLFLPSVEEIYPAGTRERRRPDLAGLDTRYEGAARPGHFDGVVQVVRRLVELVQPRVMLMGQKDAQQVAVLRRAAAQEFWPVEIVAAKIVREPSGLAMSSRNGQLSKTGFAKAAIINECLNEAEAAWLAGQTPRKIEVAAQARLTASGLRPEYFDFIHADTFVQLPDLARQHQNGEVKPLIVVVAWLEGVRLIDNRPLDLPLRAESETSPNVAANL